MQQGLARSHYKPTANCGRSSIPTTPASWSQGHPAHSAISSGVLRPPELIDEAGVITVKLAIVNIRCASILHRRSPRVRHSYSVFWRTGSTGELRSSDLLSVCGCFWVYGNDWKWLTPNEDKECATNLRRHQFRGSMGEGRWGKLCVNGRTVSPSKALIGFRCPSSRTLSNITPISRCCGSARPSRPPVPGEEALSTRRVGALNGNQDRRNANLWPLKETPRPPSEPDWFSKTWLGSQWTQADFRAGARCVIG